MIKESSLLMNWKKQFLLEFDFEGFYDTNHENKRSDVFTFFALVCCGID